MFLGCGVAEKSRSPHGRQKAGDGGVEEWSGDKIHPSKGTVSLSGPTSSGPAICEVING